MCMKDSATCKDDSCPNWNRDLDCCNHHAKVRAESRSLGEWVK